MVVWRLVVLLLGLISWFPALAAPLKADFPIVHQPPESVRALNLAVDQHSRLWMASGTRGLLVYDGGHARLVPVAETSRAYALVADGDWMYVAFHEGVFRVHTETLQYEKIVAGQFRELLLTEGLLLGILTQTTQLVAFDVATGAAVPLEFADPAYSFHASSLVKTPAGEVYFLSLPDADLHSALLRFRPGEPVQVFKPDPAADFVQHADDLRFFTLTVHQDELVIVNRHDKLLRFNPQSGQFSLFASLGSNRHGIRNAIFVEDCLVGAGTNGLFIRCPDAQFSYNQDYSSFYSLPDSHQARLLYDPQQQMLWTLSFGMELSGFYLGELPFLNAFKGGRNALQDKQPFAVLFDREAALWVGSNGFGVDQFLPSGERRHFPLATGAADATYHVISLYQLDDGRMLAGSIDGHVLSLAPGAEDFALWLPQRLDAAISNFYQQGSTLYFTSLRTLYRLDLSSGEITGRWSSSGYFGGAILLDLQVAEQQVTLATQAGLMVFDLPSQQSVPVSQLLPDGAACAGNVQQLSAHADRIYFKGGGLCAFEPITRQVHLLDARFPAMGNLHVSSSGTAWSFDGSLHAYSSAEAGYQRFQQYQGLLPDRPSQGFNTLSGYGDKVVLAHSSGIAFFDHQVLQPLPGPVLPEVRVLLSSITAGSGETVPLTSSEPVSVRQADRLVKASFDVVNYFHRDLRFAMRLNDATMPVELTSLREVFLPLEQQGVNRLQILVMDVQGNALGRFELDYRVQPFWYKNSWFYGYFFTVMAMTVVLAWRYRERIYRTRQNLLKAVVAKQSSDLTHEVYQSQNFLRHFIQLLRQDIDSAGAARPLIADSAPLADSASALRSLEHKLNFARMLNDGVAGRHWQPERLELYAQVQECIGFLVVLYHDYLGKVVLAPAPEGGALFARLPRDLISMAVTRLLVACFLHDSKPGEVQVAVAEAEGSLLLSARIDTAAVAPKPVPQQVLSRMFPPEVLQYYAELLMHSAITLEQANEGAELVLTARFCGDMYPLHRDSPLPEDPVDNDVVAGPACPLAVLEGATVLLVEDNAFMLNLIADSLGRYVNVVCCMDAETAMDRFEQQMPDVVLVDLHLPGSSGLDLCHWVRGQRGGADLPVFIMSGDDDRQILIDAARANANDFIVKPIDFELFVPKLCFHLGQYKALLARAVKGTEYTAPAAAPLPAVLPAARPAQQQDVIQYSRVSASSDFMARLMAAVEELIPQADKTIDDLAARFHTSPRNFRRKVLSAVQMTPKELLKVRRLQHAADLLKSTDLSVTEISYRCGYASQSNFNRQFKTVFDCAPLDYRKNLQGTPP